MILFLLVTVLLTIYLSLYPLEFHSVPLDRNPLWMVLQSWPEITRRSAVDLISNIAFYIPLGVSGRLAIGRYCRDSIARSSAIALGAALSASIEVTQLFTTSRFGSGADLLANICGTVIGALLGRLLIGRALSHPGNLLRQFEGSVAALVLLGCWVIYQLFPLIPDMSLYRVQAKVSAFSLGARLELFVATADWIAVFILAMEILQRRRAWVLICLVLTTPARFLVLGRSVNLAELAAPAVALILVVFLKRHPRRQLYAAILLGVAVILRGLAPFRIEPLTAAFNWAPFASTLNGPEASAAILTLKIFRYGAILWLFSAARIPLAVAASICIVTLAFVEVAQMYISGHVPESTDPLLAILLSFGLLGSNRLFRNRLGAECGR